MSGKTKRAAKGDGMKLYAVHYQALVSSVVFIRAPNAKAAGDYVHSGIDPGILLDAAAVGGAVDEDAKVTRVHIEKSDADPDATVGDPWKKP